MSPGPKTIRLLSKLLEISDATTDHLGAFLLSAGSTKELARNLNFTQREFYSTFNALKKSGYLRKHQDENNQFLITPKAIKKIKIEKIQQTDRKQEKCDGFWRIISFDIPEAQKKERNVFRSLIKRKGFLGLQNSVFIAPFADFEMLDELRRELKIEKYVSFFVAKSHSSDDDSALKQKFNL